MKFVKCGLFYVNLDQVTMLVPGDHGVSVHTAGGTVHVLAREYGEALLQAIDLPEPEPTPLSGE